MAAILKLICRYVHSYSKVCGICRATRMIAKRPRGDDESHHCIFTVEILGKMLKYPLQTPH